MLPHALRVMRQFPFSHTEPGVRYFELRPVSWNEATTLEQRFRPGIDPEQAVLRASDQLHEDYAYVFDAAWDLWQLSEKDRQWSIRPSPVKFIVHGVEFDDGVFEQEGHIQVDFGLDSQFLQEQVALSSETEARIRANVQKLVDFTNRIEQHSGASARLLWSESDDNLAQKLVARLQMVQ